MVAFATVAVAQPRNPFLNWTIVSAVELFTMVWFYVNRVQISMTIRPIKALIFKGRRVQISYLCYLGFIGH
jgi:hypothetical protein